jgi:hypothetical protein
VQKARIPSHAFLDDTTTKHVIVDAGKLSGIVDVDVVCFGDPLFTTVLAQMALLNKGHDLDYIVFWSDLKEQPELIDHRAVMRLTGILDNLLASL